MAQKQIQKERGSTKQRSSTSCDEAPANVQDEKLSSDTADILDEIDELLEPNAQEFVQNYIQKGGE